MRLQPVCLAVNASGGLLVRGVDQAEDLALGFIDPVVPVVDAVFALDPDIGLVGADHVARLHTGDVVDIQIRRRRLFLPALTLTSIMRPSARRVHPAASGTGAKARIHARLAMNLMESFVGTSAPEVIVTSRVTLEPAFAVDSTMTLAVMR